MPFKPGQSGNPAGAAKRPRGHQRGSVSGRTQALQVLDGLLGKRTSKRTMNAALAKYMKNNTIEFFKTIIMPLLPKESKLSVANDGIVEWKTLVEAFPKQEAVVEVIPKGSGVVALPPQKGTAGSGGL
jgi:hypothetical protein